jgi:hypothetical protein
MLMVCGVCDSSDCSGLEAAVNGNSEARFRSPAYMGGNRCARRAAGAQRVCGEDVPCYFIDALLQRAWMQNGDAEAPLLGVRALMSHAVQLPERAALDVWALHEHFEVACWDTSVEARSRVDGRLPSLVWHSYMQHGAQRTIAPVAAIHPLARPARRRLHTADSNV